jgi:hypothetical protein
MRSMKRDLSFWLLVLALPRVALPAREKLPKRSERGTKPRDSVFAAAAQDWGTTCQA